LIDFAGQDFDVEEIFGSAGALSAGCPAYEDRPQQKQMASAVYNALHNHRHLAVEAGTGVGKSFAYLIPALEIAKQHECRILISTYTITLQEQLINKDLPFLSRLLDNNFTAVLAKGRNNFVCRRRLEFATRRGQGLFDSDMATLVRLGNWAKQTEDGSLSDIGFSPSPQIWQSVMSEHGNCKGRNCPHFNKCFYWRNRRRLESAQIIVANHALLFSDLVLSQQNVSILPEYRYVIIDEAHNIEHVAEDHFGLNISDGRVSFILNGLYNQKTKKGLLARAEYAEAVELVKSCQNAQADFFKAVGRWFEADRGNGSTRPGFVSDCISEHIKKLRLGLAKLAGGIEDADEKFELLRFAEMLGGLEADIKSFLSHDDKDCVHWVESEKNKRKTITLQSAPLNPAANIKKCLFEEFESVVLTSATLCTGEGKGGQEFNYFAERNGLDDFDKLKLGSPFDYQKQVVMYIEPDLPEPNAVAFAEAAAEKIKKYIKQTNGSAFVLFTSYQMLQQFAEMLGDWFSENSIELLVQGTGADRAELLRRFKEDTGSVLFGTDSFWQGVDVPGAALSNVIITKLPFAVPTHPLIAGRIEHIKTKGQNPFFSYQLPAAIIKFKQGFGRLIRSKTDTGIVVVLDSRIASKGYGREFISAIEKCRVEMAD